MSASGKARTFAALTAPEILARLSRRSILCLPIGSTEQHGPHLPLDTDAIIAERFTQQLVRHYADHHDLWALPTLPYGLSPEHAWSPGTVSLNIATLTGLLHTMIGSYARATPARRLLIVNAHGGNHGILGALTYELQQAHQIAVCVINPSSLTAGRITGELPEIHGGVHETSLMLALAPGTVRLDQVPAGFAADTRHQHEINQLICRRGSTWPWSSDEPGISSLGVIGNDPRKASADIGRSLVAHAINESAGILTRLATTTSRRLLEQRCDSPMRRKPGSSEMDSSSNVGSYRTI